MRGRYSLRVVAVSAVVFAGCTEAPTQPPRFGAPIHHVRCEPPSATALICRAIIACLGGPCPPRTAEDVTASVIWSTEHPDIARISKPGQIEAVAPGHTVITATNDGYIARQSVTVFPGTQPMPTAEISGSITFAGTGSSSTRAIDGALVEVLNGPIAGYKATSGVAPQLLPGFSGGTGPGYYRILGVPAGTFTIRVTKDGYMPEERDVVASEGGGPVANFDLRPASSNN